MGKIFYFALTVLILNNFVTGEVNFNILNPKVPDLMSRNYKMTLANYGFIPYGRNLVGNLHYANNTDACSPIVSFSSEKTPILLIERGNCTFVTKTHYAELGGAKMAIIIDSVEENEDRIIMIDDGFGSNIHIPTVMVEKEDGDHLLEYLKRNKDGAISVSITFEKVKYS